nr:hypothetical protein, secreted [uncultured archaeon]CBH39551.1 hypothetical protein BSM_30300 [uncultured archaeon]
MKTRMVAGLLALTVIATSIGGISAQNNFSIEPPVIDHQWSGGQWLMNRPTGEQRQEMQQQMQMFLPLFSGLYSTNYPSGPKLAVAKKAGINDKVRIYLAGFILGRRLV